MLSTSGGGKCPSGERLTAVAAGGRYYRPPRGRILVSGMPISTTDASSMDSLQSAMRTPCFRLTFCSLAGSDAELEVVADERELRVSLSSRRYLSGR